MHYTGNAKGIKTDDCRATIHVKEGSWDTFFKTFTCTYRKTKSGTIMGSFCQAVETNSAGVCTAVYSYEKKSLGVHEPERSLPSRR
jgi:hypothetical protein